MDKDNLGHSEFPDRLRLVELLHGLHLPNRQDRGNVVAELRSRERRPLVRSLARLLLDADANVRCDAAEAFLRVDSDRGVEAVLPLLHTDPDSRVRWYICGLIHDFGDKGITPHLLEVLANDPEPCVRLAAAYALEKIGDSSSIPGLTRASQHDDGVDYEGRPIRDAARDAIDAIRRREIP